MALLPFHWCFNEVSLLAAWASDGLSRALLVLIIVDFVTLVGRNVVMVSLLDHVRVLQSFSWMSS